MTQAFEGLLVRTLHKINPLAYSENAFVNTARKETLRKKINLTVKRYFAPRRHQVDDRRQDAAISQYADDLDVVKRTIDCGAVAVYLQGETREFSPTRPEPQIAFKTLASDAVYSREGFKFALEGGADFLRVGIYNFQIVDDVNIYAEIVKNPIDRSRRLLDDVDREKYEAELEEQEEDQR